MVLPPARAGEFLCRMRGAHRADLAVGDRNLHYMLDQDHAAPSALALLSVKTSEMVMKHTIEQTEDGLRISAEAPQDKQRGLLDELTKCAAGTCSCPTPQYGKLSAIDEKADPSGVTLDLKIKPGEQLDTADIEKCLQHTAQQAGL